MDFLDNLKYTFQNPQLLQKALHHPSLPFTPPSSYERFEFLGDRVLGLVIAEFFIQQYSQENEGILARYHVSMVRKETLAEVAKNIGLDKAFNISKGEEAGGGRENISILADTCEALIAAVYLDGGLEAARAFILHHWAPFIQNVDAGERLDPKSALQELALKTVHKIPEYKVVTVTGPDHAPHFTLEVHLPGYAPQRGHGKSRREAEQQAAKLMLLMISSKDPS